MTESRRADAPAPAAGPNWKRRIVLGGIGLVLLILGYFFAAAFLPRWWAHRVGSQCNGRFRGGIWWGSFYGVLFTVIPLAVARQAIRKRWKKWQTRVGIVVAALVLAAPNLMTLGIVLGGGSGAHAGRRTLDNDAPGFRGATLIGVIIAVLILAGVQYLVSTRHRRGRELTKLRAEKKIRDADAEPPQAPPA